MVIAYGELGMPGLRDDARRVMEKNFPESPFITGRAKSESWWKFW
jgi:outer membrane protein assembly factor BamD